MYNRVISYLYYSKILFPSGFIVNIEIIRSSIADLIFIEDIISKRAKAYHAFALILHESSVINRHPSMQSRKTTLHE